jgi:hypothetical protein
VKQLDLVVTFKGPTYKGYGAAHGQVSVPLEPRIILAGDCPESGGAITTLAFSLPGQAFVEHGRLAMPFPGITGTLLGVNARVHVAPTGASIIVDVNKSGSTIFSDQSLRPAIAAGTKTSGWVSPQVTSITNTDYLTVDVDQVGSVLAGGDLVVAVRYSE